MNQVRQIIVAICLFLTVACLAATTFFIHNLLKPARATAFLTVASTNAPFNMDPVAVHNTYANFTYPAGMVPMKTQLPSGHEVALFSYSHRDIESWQLAITINTLPNSTLTDDSGYLFRKNNPSRYQQSTANIHATPILIMTDTQAGGFSKVAFLAHGTLSADISLYGDDSTGTDVLTKAFNQVLSSWHWNS